MTMDHCSRNSSDTSQSIRNEPVNCSSDELAQFLNLLNDGYLPCISSEPCTSSPGLGEGYLPTYYSDTSQSVQSKSMSIASRSYQRGKKTVSFHGFQSLQMSRNLTEGHGAALLTWYLAAFPAKTSAQPAEGQESTESEAGYGARWPALLARYDRDTCSWKTPQCSLFEDSEPSLETWPRSGLMLDGACFQLPPLAHRIEESGYGLWPTPTCGGGGQTLPEGTTPTGKTPEGRKQTVCLERYVQRVERKVWPTPTVAMANGSSGGSLTRKTGKSRENDRLDYAVEGDAKNDCLNPTWVEKLMGWPDDWTLLKPISHVKMCFWLMGMHDGTETGTAEVLRVLRQGDAAQEIQWALGRPVGVHEAALLLAELCEHANRPDEARVFMACAEALEEEMRGVRLCEGATGAPHRPEQGQQRAGEHPDAMQALSRLLAHHGKAYWQDGRWEDATPRVAHGVAARVDRFKALGNGQVPQCAAHAWRLLTSGGHEDGNTRRT